MPWISCLQSHNGRDYTVLLHQICSDLSWQSEKEIQLYQGNDMPFCESSILGKKVFLFSSNKYYQLMFINISHAIKHDCFLFQQWLKNDNHTKNYYINFCFYVQQGSSECVCIHSSPIPMVSREVRRWHWKIQNWRYRGLSVDTWEQKIQFSTSSQCS